LPCATPAPGAHAGPLAWREAAPGFEVAELDVIAEGKPVDRILEVAISTDGPGGGAEGFWEVMERASPDFAPGILELVHEGEHLLQGGGAHAAD